MKNPQANSILERAHAAVSDHLRFLRTIDPKDIMQDDDPWENMLMSASFAINSTIHTASQVTPGQMVFHRGVILHATHVAN